MDRAQRTADVTKHPTERSPCLVGPPPPDAPVGSPALWALGSSVHISQRTPELAGDLTAGQQWS